MFGNGDIATKTYNKIRYKYNVHGIFDNKKHCMTQSQKIN